jgi:hypothetical protein
MFQGLKMKIGGIIKPKKVTTPVTMFVPFLDSELRKLEAEGVAYIIANIGERSMSFSVEDLGNTAVRLDSEGRIPSILKMPGKTAIGMRWLIDKGQMSIRGEEGYSVTPGSKLSALLQNYWREE